MQMPTVTSLTQISGRARMELVTFLEPYFARRKDINAAVSGLGGGGVSKKHLDVLWQGQQLPTSPGPGGVWLIPQLNGANVSYKLTQAYLFFETAVAGTNAAKVQYSTDGGATWTDIVTCTVATAHSNLQTIASVTLASGNLIRINWITVTDTTNVWTMQVEGDQP